MSTADEFDPVYVKRKVFPGNIDIHPSECAIIVNYTVQATILGEDGQPVVADKKSVQKTIRVNALHTNSNLSALAEEIINKGKLIHPSKQQNLEQLLYYLQQRHRGDRSNDSATLRKQLPKRCEAEVVKEPDEVATMEDLGSYIELLYEEISDKLRCTGLILQLAKKPDNLEELANNDSLMSALSRVLREDAKRSLDLTTNIINIYFCFSNFPQFHPLITSNKVGDMCLKIIDQEMTRSKVLIEESEKAKLKPVKEAEQETRKIQNMHVKQDQLLFLTCHLLLNLADDISIEIKMVKRGIVEQLLKILDRDNLELIMLLVTFLKKFSVFKENKDLMLANASTIITSLVRFLPSQYQSLYGAILRLLLNLSHDSEFRGQMIRAGLVSKLVDILRDESLICVELLSLLYQLSLDDRTKAMFTYTDAVPLILKLILETKGERVNAELMALTINLCSNEHNAEIFCEDKGFKFLMKRALQTKDPLLMKMIRTISFYDGPSKLLFLEFVDDLMLLYLKFVSPELTVEITGILSSLTIPDFDYAKLVETYNLGEIIADTLGSAINQVKSPGTGISGLNPVEDDLLLECAMFCGTIAEDENMAPIFVRNRLPQILVELLTRWFDFIC